MQPKDAQDPELVLVDGEDREVGKESKLSCHVLPGHKHRAFTALVLDAEGRVLLARRAAGKMLWPDHWDGTVASHPVVGETYEAAAERRLGEELGASCELVVAGRFDYRVRFRDVGVEDELCAALFGRFGEGVALAPNPDEISEVRAVTLEEFTAELERSPGELCPWLYLLLMCAGRWKSPPPEFEELCSTMRAPGVAQLLEQGLEHHFGPSDAAEWRILDGSEDAA